jgi:REP element-mobilizing transposase RayT
MGRRRRLEYAGATYHVYCRGNRGTAVYGTADEYDEYLADLARLSREHGTRVIAFALMPNHPHLCVRTDGDPLSVLMHRLSLRHARRFNRVYSLRGHLNERRYHAKIVDNTLYLLALVRYIHQNPVCAHLVGRHEDWPYSSHRAYLGNGFPWVDTREVLGRLGGKGGYLRWMDQTQPDDERQLIEALWRASRSKELAPLALVCTRIQKSPWKTQPPSKPIEEVFAELAEAAGFSMERLRSASREPPWPQARRALAVQLRLRGYRLYEIGRVLGRQEAAVCKLVRGSRRHPFTPGDSDALRLE